MSDEPLALDEQEASGEEGTELTAEQKAFNRLKEVIRLEKQEVGSLRLKLGITVPRDVIDERLTEQFAELRRDAAIPGFRKGHAPIRLVEKRFATDVGDQLKGQLIGSSYLAAVEKEDLKPLGDPLVWCKVKEERSTEGGGSRQIESDKLLPIDRALEHIILPKEGPLTFSCEVELKPQFELPNQNDIPVNRPRITVDDGDVEDELRRLRAFRGTFQPVEDGPIALDDLIYADTKMTVGQDVLLQEQNLDLAARDLRIKGIPLIGLGEALEAKERNAVVVFEAPVPDDHEDIDLRGKKARFEFTIKEIKRLALPPIDGEFLEGVGFDSEDDLRASLKRALEARVAQAVQDKMHEQVADYLIAKTTVEIPAGLSQRQTDRSVARRMIEMYRAGIPEAEIRKAVDEMKVKAHDQVVRDLKLYFILEKIAEERKVEVSEEQLNSAISLIAQRTGKRFDRVRDELSKGDGLSTLYVQIRDQKVLEDLLTTAAITDTEVPKKRAAKKSEVPAVPAVTPARSLSAPKTEAARRTAAPEVATRKAPPKTLKKTAAPKASGEKKTTKKPSPKKTARKKST